MSLVPTRRRIGPSIVPLLLLACLCLPSPSRAQLLEPAAGFALGVSGGAVVTLGILTARSSAGHFLHSKRALSWEGVPVAVGAVAGALMGSRNPDRLWRTAGWGAMGLAGGALVGGLTGWTLTREDEGTWTGALVGGAAGLLLGSLTGGLTWDGEERSPAPVLLLRLPAFRVGR